MNVVLDTNVLISAIFFDGLPRTVFRRALRGEVRNVLSPAILHEVGEVLRRPKFHLSPEQVAAMVQLLRDSFEIVYPRRVPRGVVRDADDHVILAAACSAEAEYVITGDRDLLVLGEWEGIRIVSPAEFEERLGER